MANTLKFGAGEWATKEGSTLAYNDENGNFKPLPFDFSRDSGATRVNKEGLIEVVGNNEPRIDFTDNSKGALLLEPARTNLVTYSQDFSSGWSLDDATVSINSGISPDGTLNATLLKGNTNSSRHNLVISAQANNTGTFSIFVKAKELKYVQIASANTTEQYVNFDLINGVIGTVGSSFSNAKIEDYGNGWYRCIVVSANQFNGFYFSLVNGLNATWLESWVMPNSTDGLYIWGAQLEQGSYATSYIPTQGSIGTRVAESCEQTPPSGIIGQTEGTIFLDVDFDTLSDLNMFLSIRPDSSNKIEIYRSDAIIYGEFASTNSFNFNKTNVTVGRYKIAVAYSSGSSAMYINGVLIGSNTTSFAFTSTLDDVSINSRGTSFIEQSNYNEVKLYNTRLSNSELQALTS